MLGRREDRHVDPDLRDDHFGRALADPADSVEARQFVRERGDALVAVAADGRDRLIQVVDVREELTDEKGVMKAAAPHQCLAQDRQLGAEPAAGQVGQHFRIRRAGDQGVQHRRGRTRRGGGWRRR
jgi:hypothetical protein